MDKSIRKREWFSKSQSTFLTWAIFLAVSTVSANFVITQINSFASESESFYQIV